MTDRSPTPPRAPGRHPTGSYCGQSVSVYTEICPERGSPLMWAAIFAAVTSPILWGWTLGYTSPTFSVSEEPQYIYRYDLNYVFAITDDQKSWLTSITILGGGIGGLLGGLPVERYGKKPVMVVANLLMLIGYVTFFTAKPVARGTHWYHGAVGDGAAYPEVFNSSVDTAPSNLTAAHGHTRYPYPHYREWVADNTWAIVQLYAARAVMGLAGGLTCMAVPSYTTEIVPLQQRGLFGCTYQFGLNIGLSSVYGLGYFLHWDTLAVIAIGVSCFGVLVTLFIPESPQWLVNKGHKLAAQASLRRLRTKDTDVNVLLTNYTAVKTDSEELLDDGAGAGLKELLKWPRNKALLLGVGLISLQQLSGINVVTCYGGEVIGEVYPNPKDANSYATYMQFGTMFIVFGQSLIMSKYDRKSFLMAAMVGVILSYVVMVVFLLSPEGSMPKWMMLVGYYAYPSTFAFGMGAIPWLMMGELFHPRVRGLASAICTAASWLSGFLVIQTATSLRAAFGGGFKGLGYLFCIYLGISVLGLFLIIRLPETRNRSYNAIERKLKGEKKKKTRPPAIDESTGLYDATSAEESPRAGRVSFAMP